MTHPTSEVIIRCRENGPLLVEGPVKVLDHQGNPFPLPTNKPAIALCRCGHSSRKPFCDGSHKATGFAACETALAAAAGQGGANLPASGSQTASLPTAALPTANPPPRQP